MFFHSNGSVVVDYDIVMDPSATVNTTALNGVFDNYISGTGGKLGGFDVADGKHEGIISCISCFEPLFLFVMSVMSSIKILLFHVPYSCFEPMFLCG